MPNATSPKSMPLAISSYQTVTRLSDDRETLILAWTLDERDCLSVDLNSVIRLALDNEIRSGLDYINRYSVKDPYGEDYLGPAVAGFFSKTDGAYCVTCGAGVISLLHSLASLAQASCALVIGNTYPDFPYWIERFSGRCIAHPASDAEWKDLAFDAAAFVFLERPSLIGDRFSDLAEVSELCRRAGSSGAMVIIDESNANYYSPAFSAVNLVNKVNNLIVLRGFSKAYGLGGLRLSYGVASNALRDRLRSAIPPLLASSLSLYIGRKVLELGDIAQMLRQRIREAKAETRSLFECAEFHEVLQSSENLPYLFIKNSECYVRTHFEDNGIVGKIHAVWSGSRREIDYVYRLSVPLRSERMDLLRQRIARAYGR
jgi:histidinol-phosphate/aromatic aminotransferase/cobyric acid decarboxylase-like protein